MNRGRAFILGLLLSGIFGFTVDQILQDIYDPALHAIRVGGLATPTPTATPTSTPTNTPTLTPTPTVTPTATPTNTPTNTPTLTPTPTNTPTDTPTNTPTNTPTGTPTQIGGSALVAYYKFDEGSGTAAIDSISANNGAWQNSPSYSATVPSAITFSDPFSISLNGTTQYATITAGSCPANHDASLTGWVKFTAAPVVFKSLNMQQSDSTHRCMMQIDSSGNGVCRFGDVASTGGIAITDTNWHFVACTFNNTTKAIKGYMDGTASGTNTAANSIGAGAATLGADLGGAGAFVNGLMDDFRVYNSELTSGQITSLNGGAR